MRRLIARLAALLGVSLRESASQEGISPQADGLPEGFVGLFKTIRHEWDQAEEVVKLAEQVTTHAVIPSIQELRYAGRRLIDALTRYAEGGSAEEVRALLDDARFSCHRARHDAIDTAIATMGIDSDALAKQMGYSVVHSSFPDYYNYLVRLDEVRERIVASRGNRTDRDRIYAAITSVDFPGLVQDYKSLRRSEITMRIINERKRLGIWLSVFFALLVAIPGYIMSYYFWKHPARPEPAPQQIEAPATHAVPAPEPHNSALSSPASNSLPIAVTPRTPAQR